MVAICDEETVGACLRMPAFHFLHLGLVMAALTFMAAIAFMGRFMAVMDFIATFALVFIADERFALLPVVRFMAFIAIAFGNWHLRWLPGVNS